MAPHEGDFENRGRTFTLTQFGIAALDRGIAQGVQESIMSGIMESGPVTSTEIIAEYTNVEPMMLKRLMDDAISKNWVEVVE